MWWINTTEKWKGVSKIIYYAAGYGVYIVIDHANDF
jgi:hypothetical protein